MTIELNEFDPATVARKAAAYIREHGLAKDELLLPDGRACFNGAVMLAFAPDGYEIPENSYDLWRLVGYGRDDMSRPDPRRNTFNTVAMAGRRILVKRFGRTRYEDIVSWNNAKERTAEEVASLLDQVALELSRA